MSGRIKQIAFSEHNIRIWDKSSKMTIFYQNTEKIDFSNFNVYPFKITSNHMILGRGHMESDTRHILGLSNPFVAYQK